MTPPSPRFLEAMGMRILREDPDRPAFAIDVDEIHKNVNGVVHGSVLHALMDSVMGMLAYRACGRRPVATAEMAVRYLSPVKEGELRATGRVVALDARRVTLEAEVEHAGAVVATATARFAILDAVP